MQIQLAVNRPLSLLESMFYFYILEYKCRLYELLKSIRSSSACTASFIAISRCQCCCSPKSFFWIFRVFASMFYSLRLSQEEQRIIWDGEQLHGTSPSCKREMFFSLVCTYFKMIVHRASRANISLSPSLSLLSLLHWDQTI